MPERARPTRDEYLPNMAGDAAFAVDATRWDLDAANERIAELEAENAEFFAEIHVGFVKINLLTDASAILTAQLATAQFNLDVANERLLQCVDCHEVQVAHENKDHAFVRHPQAPPSPYALGTAQDGAKGSGP